MKGKMPPAAEPRFFSSLPSPQKAFAILKKPPQAAALVICDRKLRSSPLIKSWLAAPRFRFYFCAAGERAKSAERLPFHLKKILALARGLAPRDLVFFSLGGGSVGDLAGFLASTYKRGAPLVHCPSTWLAALDSAHGGKTALNFQGVKNFIGTYHFPEMVFVSWGLLKEAPESGIRSAFGELLKISLIAGGGLFRELKAILKAGGPAPCLSPQNMEKALKDLLKKAIAAKMEAVRADPLETKGIRKKLSLGHTTGHIMESALGLPHGEAVLRGVLFSLKWSRRRGFLSAARFKEAAALVPASGGAKAGKGPQIPAAAFKKLLREDKKRAGALKWDFLFVRGPGEVFARPVSEGDLLKEARRQGIVKGA